MSRNYSQLDLQSLLDLLVEETQHYTIKAIICAIQSEPSIHKTNIDAIITEIRYREKEGFLSKEGQKIASIDLLQSSSSACDRIYEAGNNK